MQQSYVATIAGFRTSSESLDTVLWKIFPKKFEIKMRNRHLRFFKRVWKLHISNNPDKKIVFYYFVKKLQSRCNYVGLGMTCVDGTYVNLFDLLG